MPDYELIPDLYLDTYIQDEFDNGFDPGWDSDFTSNWSIVDWSGDNTAFKDDLGENTVVAGPIEGYFDFQMKIRLGPAFTGNHSSRFYIRDYSDDTEYCSLGRDTAGTNLIFDNTSTTNTVAWAFSAYDTRYVRLLRGNKIVDDVVVPSGSDDTIYGYYSTDGMSWTEFGITAPSGGGADIYLNIDGANDCGISWIKLQSHRGQYYWNVYESTEVTWVQ